MAIMIAADSSYFWSPTPSGAAAVHTFPHRLHRSFSNSYTVAAMGAYPLIRTNTPGSRWRYTLPSQAVSGHASPAFNDACGTLTFCAPPYAAAPWRPCPAAARFGFPRRFPGPASSPPSRCPPAPTPGRFSPCWQDTTTLAAPPGWFPSSPATRSHNPACGSRRATFHSPLRPAPAEPAPTMPPVPRSRHPTAGRPLAAEASCFYSLPSLAKPWSQRIAQHLFNRPVRPVRLVVLAASRGAPQQHPVRRPVAGPAKPFRIHEGLQKIDGVPIGALPVLRQPLGDAAENVRGQVRHRHPGQNREATVVGQKADVAPPGFRIPADVAVAAAQVPRRRTPSQTGNRPPLGPQKIFEMLAHRLLVAQVVVVLHQAVEQRLIGGAPHRLDLPRAQSRKRHGQRRGVEQDRLGPGTRRPAWPADLTAGCPLGPAAIRSGRPAPASAADRGIPRRAGRRWPASSPGLRITGGIASSGCWWDAPV